MPVLVLGVLVLGAVIASGFLFSQRSPKEIRLVLSILLPVVVALVFGLLLLAGRVAMAFILLGLVFPFFKRLWRVYPAADENASSRGTKSGGLTSGAMSYNEALDVLGLEAGAERDDVEKVYRTLMLKVHPDQGGSDWLATQLTQARDILLSALDDE
jgi:hypothetical protein